MISVFYGAHSVSNDDDGHTAMELYQCIANASLIGGVKRAGGLVQDQQAWFAS